MVIISFLFFFFDYQSSPLLLSSCPELFVNFVSFIVTFTYIPFFIFQMIRRDVSDGVCVWFACAQMFFVYEMHECVFVRLCVNVLCAFVERGGACCMCI